MEERQECIFSNANIIYAQEISRLKKSNFDGTFHISQELYGETSAAPIIHLKGLLGSSPSLLRCRRQSTVLQAIKSRL